MSSVRILAVDDDAHQLAAVRRVLRRSGFEVATCTNPRRALKLAIAEPPDLILLDVCMPVISGHEFLRRLRRAETAAKRERRTPVIFLSGLVASRQRVSGLDAGAEDYIGKPFDAEELRARIRNQLRRAHPSEVRPAAKAAPAFESGEFADLLAALCDIRDSVRSCETPLGDVLLVAAKNEVRKLADSLAKFAAAPDTIGDCP